MDLIAGFSIAEQIEILQLIEQQLSATVRLQYVVRNGSSVVRRRISPPYMFDRLYLAIEKGCAEAEDIDAVTASNRLELVRSKLKELKAKQNELMELGAKCKDLIEAATRVQKYVTTETSRKASMKRDRDSTDLDNLGAHADEVARACKKIREHK